MRRPGIPLVTAVLILALACNKSDLPGIAFGTYQGTFQRQVNGTGPVSRVTLLFTANHWAGQSEYPQYPALCRGSFRMNSDHSIIFRSDCGWTGEVDGSLILANSYEYKLSGNHLELVRQYPDGSKDIYELQKQ